MSRRIENQGSCKSMHGLTVESLGRGVQWASFWCPVGIFFEFWIQWASFFSLRMPTRPHGSKVRIPTRPPRFRWFYGLNLFFGGFLRVLRLRVFRVQGFSGLGFLGFRVFRV